jgi:hypothetical protein
MRYASRCDDAAAPLKVKVLPSVSVTRTITTPGATSIGVDATQQPARSTAALAIRKVTDRKVQSHSAREPDPNPRNTQR